MSHFLFNLSAFIALFSSVPLVSRANPTLPNDVRWVQSSKEYKVLCEYIFRKAAESVQKQVGLFKAEGSKEKIRRYVVVVDLDETVLDNSFYQIERWRAGLGFTQDSWSLWVKRKQAELVPGAKSFLDSVRNNGIQVIFLSNRMSHNLKSTQENLLKLGALDSTDLFLLRQNKLDTKQKRRTEIMTGTGRMDQLGPSSVICYVGDQMGDFPSDQASGLGRKYFLLPNPMYGKW
jgi:5'-nucleotidase (lipoprotein e(P4) family)